MKLDVYTRITDQIVQALEQGVRPWMKPWDAAHAAGPVSRPLRATGKPYGGINVVMLWASAMEQGFSAPLWMTFRQAKELGAHVRKGAKGAFGAPLDPIDQRACPRPLEPTARAFAPWTTTGVSAPASTKGEISLSLWKPIDQAARSAWTRARAFAPWTATKGSGLGCAGVGTASG